MFVPGKPLLVSLMFVGKAGALFMAHSLPLVTSVSSWLTNNNNCVNAIRENFTSDSFDTKSLKNYKMSQHEKILPSLSSLITDI